MAEDEARARYRERLSELHEHATRDFDKAIMTLSGAALAVSIAFIHDVAKHPHYKVLLAASWVCFGLSLSLILASFLTSEQAIVRMIEGIDEERDEIERSAWTDRLNQGSAAFFLVGVLCLVIFALLNV